jgi:hypothetical protein
MKYLVAIIALVMGLNAAAQEEYSVQINDSVYDVAANKKYVFNNGGTRIYLTLKAKDTLTYQDDFFSFLYSKNHKISKLVLEQGVEQIIIMTAEGSGMLIQKYTTLNPTNLNETMLAELTRESLNSGFESKRTNYTRTLKSGQKITVNKAVLKNAEETNIYEVASVGEKNTGIMIITMIMDEEVSQQARKIIELMWKSLTIK